MRFDEEDRYTKAEEKRLKGLKKTRAGLLMAACAVLCALGVYAAFFSSYKPPVLLFSVGAGLAGGGVMCLFTALLTLKKIQTARKAVLTARLVLDALFIAGALGAAVYCTGILLSSSLPEDKATGLILTAGALIVAGGIICKLVRDSQIMKNEPPKPLLQGLFMGSIVLPVLIIAINNLLSFWLCLPPVLLLFFSGLILQMNPEIHE